MWVWENFLDRYRYYYRGRSKHLWAGEPGIHAAISHSPWRTSDNCLVYQDHVLVRWPGTELWASGTDGDGCTRGCTSKSRSAYGTIHHSTLSQRCRTQRDGNSAWHHGYCDCPCDRLGGDHSPGVTGSNEDVASARTAGHSSRTPGSFVGMEWRLAPQSARPWPMGAP